ncbi:hypothetical protein HanIR_Chr12g0606641 [Helianthus annuus]|nr:hypothetical protein HanIR_Chr12g0606641 [Helianthus annuus]
MDSYGIVSLCLMASIFSVPDTNNEQQVNNTCSCHTRWSLHTHPDGDTAISFDMIVILVWFLLRVQSNDGDVRNR